MYPSTIYRVVAKALITDENGRILVVKEGQDFWSLPGGGLEHGESAQDCLKREIKEEIGVDNAEIGEIAYSTTVHLDQRDIWMTWIVYNASISSSEFTFGDGVTDAKYIAIEEIENSTDLLEKLIVETVQAVTRPS
jgi:8-oxo-dGTP diphosphatase